MLDPRVTELRAATVARLRAHFVAGELSTGTFESRLALALDADSARTARSALWDLAPRRLRPVDGIATPVGWLASGEVRASWLLGRDEACDVDVDLIGVSRRHARVRKRGRCWTIEDLGSTNGTLVNGRPVARAVLKPGDVVVLGDDRARLEVAG